jgi:hypothetical protein
LAAFHRKKLRLRSHIDRVKKTLSKKTILKLPLEKYGGLIGGIAELLETARRTAARTVNALMTATYWEIGRRTWNSSKKARRAPVMAKNSLPNFPTT